MSDRTIDITVSDYLFNKNHDKVYYCFAIFAFALVLGGFFLYEISFWDLLKYFIYQLVYIFLPGYQINRWLRLKGDLSDKAIVSYGLGIVMQIVLYIIFLYSGALTALYFTGPLLSVVLLATVFRNNELNHRVLLRVREVLPPQFWFIYSTLVFIAFCGLTLVNPDPDLAGTASYPLDVIWMIGNAQALLRNIPPFDARISGVVINYHYFAAVYWAAMSYITKISVFDIVFKYYQLGNLLLICGSIYILGKTIFKELRKAIAFLWVYLFTDCASLLYPIFYGHGRFTNFNFVHITEDPFGFELALPLFLLCTILCINQISSDRMHWRGLIASAAFIAACTGAKGISGFMIIGALFAVIVVTFINKQRSSSLIYTLVLSGVVLFIYAAFIAPIYPSSAGRGLSISPGYATKGVMVLLKDLFPLNEFSENVKLLISSLLIPFHFFLYLPFAAFLFIAWTFRKLPQLFKITKQEIFLSAVAVCGIVLTYLFKHVGNSQMYFIMFSIPFITVCGMKWLFDYYQGMNDKLKIFILCLFIIGSISSASKVIYQGMAGISTAANVLSGKSNPQQHYPLGDSITSYEYEAIRWLNKNTDTKAIIASNRCYLTHEKNDPRYFYFSTFANRQLYLEGWEYTNSYVKEHIIPYKTQICEQLYYGKGADKERIMKSEGIDYLLVSRFVQKDLQIFDEQLAKVFENRDIVIYSRE